MDLIISSLTLQPNLFQLFQPIGGVSATPLSHARAAGTPEATQKIAKKNTNAIFEKCEGFTEGLQIAAIIQDFSLRERGEQIYFFAER